MNRRASVLLLAVFALAGCGSVVPPGKTVIIRKPSGETKIVEKGVYKSWGRDRLYFVDGKLKSFNENGMKILCADDINMDIDVKILLSFTVDESSIEFIQSKVPATKVDDGDVKGFELSLTRFYAMAVQPIVRAATRTVISPYITDDIRPNRELIAAEIDALVRSQIIDLGYPLQISAVLLSNIDYPQVVKTQREAIKTAQLEDQRKAALAEAAVAEAQRQVGVETELAKVRLIKARAQADENAILTSSLTPAFLLWRQFEVLENTASNLAQGDSNTVFMMPFSAINPDMLQTVVLRDGFTSSKDTAAPATN